MVACTCMQFTTNELIFFSLSLIILMTVLSLLCKNAKMSVYKSSQRKFSNHGETNVMCGWFLSDVRYGHLIVCYRICCGVRYCLKRDGASLKLALFPPQVFLSMVLLSAHFDVVAFLT